MPSEQQISQMAQEYLRRQGYTIKPPRSARDPRCISVAMHDGIYDVTFTASGVPTMVVKRKTIWVSGKPESDVAKQAIEMAKRSSHENNCS